MSFPSTNDPSSPFIPVPRCPLLLFLLASHPQQHASRLEHRVLPSPSEPQRNRIPFEAARSTTPRKPFITIPIIHFLIIILLFIILLSYLLDRHSVRQFVKRKKNKYRRSKKIFPFIDAHNDFIYSQRKINSREVGTGELE